MVKPTAWRHAVGFLQTDFEMSERRACRVIGVCRATAQYRSRRTDPAPLVAKLRELAAVRPRWGYRRLHILLRREGITVNHKRVYRLYRAEGLAVRQRRRKRLASALRTVLPPPSAPNERWSMDFVSDQLVGGTRLRAFNVVDDFTRECLAI
jgi:putative transposase